MIWRCPTLAVAGVALIGRVTGDVWPACQEQNTVIRNAGRALFSNFQGFGATVGCFQDDCQNTDKFVASSIESCSKVCLSLPECEFWVWGQEEGEQKCWFRLGDDGREAGEGWISGAKSCHPPNQQDFGLARVYTVPLKSYTHEVVTLWYRAPEILLGGNKYAMPIDVWSLGCISSEMATGQALFPGDSEIDTIFKIFRTLGTPTDAVWPGISMMRDFKKTFPKWSRGHMEEAYVGSALDAHGLDFLQQCLVYNPVDRTSAKRLLQHRFFDELQPVIVHPPARYEQGIKEARPVNGSPTETGDGIAAGCRGS